MSPPQAYAGCSHLAGPGRSPVNKDDISTASMIINFFNPDGTKTLDASLITPRNTDLVVYRDTHCLFRGRIKAFQIDYSPDSQRTATIGGVLVTSTCSLAGEIADADCGAPDRRRCAPPATTWWAQTRPPRSSGT